MPVTVKKILIIDDEADICEFSKRMLERTGRFKALFTQDSEKGIDLAKSEKPDLILLDINMPKIDGGAVAQELSESSITKGIPIIFITALMKKEETDAEGKVNKHHFLAKPVTSADLIGKIDKVLGSKA
jgi:CheY-like chemotaxis protein